MNTSNKNAIIFIMIDTSVLKKHALYVEKLEKEEKNQKEKKDYLVPLVLKNLKIKIKDRFQN